MIDNNNNSQMSNPDEDPTVELEQLSETACAELMRADDSTSSEIQELRDELKFRDEMNSILQLGIDHQREKCRSLAEQISSLQETNEELRHELDQTRKQTTKTEQKLVEARESEQSLLNKLKELAKANATNADLKTELESSKARIDGYKNQLAALRRASSVAVRESPRRAPGFRQTPSNRAEDCWMLVGLDSKVPDTFTVADGIVTIGSSPDSDIQIQSEFISQHHAQLINTHKGCVLGDLGSTNGTFINSRRINKRVLRAGDIVTIGKHRFRYEKQSAITNSSDINRHAHSLN
ncbi:MAG: FHA domain-containing protein [Woeseiaceae bacterium]